MIRRKLYRLSQLTQTKYLAPSSNPLFYGLNITNLQKSTAHSQVNTGRVYRCQGLGRGKEGVFTSVRSPTGERE